MEGNRGFPGPWAALGEGIGGGNLERPAARKFAFLSLKFAIENATEGGTPAPTPRTKTPYVEHIRPKPLDWHRFRRGDIGF